jgi:hypothetical protein
VKVYSESHASTASSATPSVSPTRKETNLQDLARRFPYFSVSEISAFHSQFAAFDKEGKGEIHTADLSNVAPKAGEAFQNVVAKLGSLGLGREDGMVTFEVFLTVLLSSLFFLHHPSFPLSLFYFSGGVLLNAFCHTFI